MGQHSAIPNKVLIRWYICENKYFRNVMELQKYKFLFNCSFTKSPHFLQRHTYPDTSQEQCQWNSAGLSGSYLWTLEEKKPQNMHLKVEKNSIKVCACTYTRIEAHIISKVHHLGIYKYIDKGELLDIVFLERQEGSWKHAGLWYRKVLGLFFSLRHMELLTTSISLTFSFIVYKTRIVRLHYKVVIRIKQDNVKTHLRSLGLQNVGTLSNNCNV